MAEWIFDICRCKWAIIEKPVINRKKLQCSCVYENWIPEKEIWFIKDQREDRKAYMSKVDIAHEKNKIEKETQRNKTNVEQPCTFGIKPREPKNAIALVMATKLRKRDAPPVELEYQLDLSEDEDVAVSGFDTDGCYQPSGSQSEASIMKRYAFIR